MYIYVTQCLLHRHITTSQHVKPWTHLHSRDSTLLMMSARSKGRGMLGSSTPQKGRSTGASSGGNVWARLEWHLRRQNTGNKQTHLLLPPIKSSRWTLITMTPRLGSLTKTFRVFFLSFSVVQCYYFASLHPTGACQNLTFT